MVFLLILRGVRPSFSFVIILLCLFILLIFEAMFLNKDFVSEVRNHLKSLNKDDYISARYILSIGYNQVQYIINNRPLSKIYRNQDVFTNVGCVEMRRIKSHSCPIGSFRTCDKIMRSKEKIPKLFNAKSGYLIESITNIDHSEEYQPLRNPKDFSSNKKRQFSKHIKYYYIHNEYLYILNTTSEIVNISGMFRNPNDAKKISTCDSANECLSPLEDKFVCPDEYRAIVISETVNLLLSGNKAIPEDENPDLDSNQKTRTS